MKTATYDRIAKMKRKAADFSARIGKRDRANDIDAESVEDYAARKGITIQNPRKAGRRRKGAKRAKNSRSLFSTKLRMPSRLRKAPREDRARWWAEQSEGYFRIGARSENAGRHDLAANDYRLAKKAAASAHRYGWRDRLPIETIQQYRGKKGKVLVMPKRNPRKKHDRIGQGMAEHRAQMSELWLRTVQSKMDGGYAAAAKFDLRQAKKFAKEARTYGYKGSLPALTFKFKKRKRNGLLSNIASLLKSKAKRAVGIKPKRIALKWDAMSQVKRQQLAEDVGLSPPVAAMVSKQSWAKVSRGWKSAIAERLSEPTGGTLTINPRHKKARRAHKPARRRHQKRPHAHKKSRNPNSEYRDAADKLYKSFHGRESDELVELDYDGILESKDYAALGDLVALRVKTDAGVYNIDFPDDEEDGDPPLLCASPDAKQLYIFGGDQNCDEMVEALEDSGKLQSAGGDKVLLGQLTHVEYFTRKGFHNFQPIIYTHQLGEETGEVPDLVYDTEKQQLHIVGGAYKIKPEGIVN